MSAARDVCGCLSSSKAALGPAGHGQRQADRQTAAAHGVLWVAEEWVRGRACRAAEERKKGKRV